MAKADKGKQNQQQQRKAEAKKKRKRENKRNHRAGLKDYQTDAIREKDRRARSKSRERKCNTAKGLAQHLVQQKEYNQRHASKMAAAKAAADEKRPMLNYVPVQFNETEKREVSAPGKIQTSLTPSKRNAVDDYLSGLLAKTLKMTELPWCLTPMKGRSVDATSRHAIQVSKNPANALGLDNYVFVEEASLHKDHFDLQEWEVQPKQPIGSDRAILCPEWLSRKTGPTLVGVVNGSSENSKLLQLLHYPKRDGDCIAIYPLPQGTFIHGSILEIDIVSSDNIVVVHLGKPRALPTIENWDVWPMVAVLGGALRTSIRGEVYDDPRLPDGSKVSLGTARPIQDRRLVREIYSVADPRVTSGKIVVVEGYMGYRLGKGIEVNDLDVSGRTYEEGKEYKYVHPPPSHRNVVNVRGENFRYILSRKGRHVYVREN